MIGSSLLKENDTISMGECNTILSAYTLYRHSVALTHRFLRTYNPDGTTTQTCVQITPMIPLIKTNLYLSSCQGCFPLSTLNAIYDI